MWDANTLPKHDLHLVSCPTVRQKAAGERRGVHAVQGWLRSDRVEITELDWTEQKAPSWTGSTELGLPGAHMHTVAGTACCGTGSDQRSNALCGCTQLNLQLTH